MKQFLRRNPYNREKQLGLINLAGQIAAKFDHKELFPIFFEYIDYCVWEYKELIGRSIRIAGHNSNIELIIFLRDQKRLMDEKSWKENKRRQERRDHQHDHQRSFYEKSMTDTFLSAVADGNTQMVSLFLEHHLLDCFVLTFETSWTIKEGISCAAKKGNTDMIELLYEKAKRGTIDYRFYTNALYEAKHPKKL